MGYNDIKHVIRHFAFEGTYASAEELTNGLINNTYHLTYNQGDGTTKDYVLQQINTYVFKKPEEVMSNIHRVTEHLADAVQSSGQDVSRGVLHLISTTEGSWMYCDEQNRYWRAYDFISGTVAYDRAESPDMFREAGRAFGMFQRQLGSFPVAKLYETIPDFHDTRRRFFTFVDSVSKDRGGHVRALEKEIDFFFDRRKMMGEIVKMIDQNELPMRVTHNDTKMNNVMLDCKTGEAVCVIDLDTVMPGSVLYDFGDAIRFGASTALEDEPDTSKIALDMDLFRAFSEGFISETNGFLTERELSLLPLGVKVIICEMAMRFLTDYIDGDVYFKTRYPDHNLVRARAQMALLEDVERRYDDMCACIAEIRRKK